MENTSNIKQIIAFAIGACILLAAVGSSLFLYNNRSMLQNDLEQKSDQIKKANDKIAELGRTNVDLQKRVDGVAKQCEAESADLKASIAAFAKQAASCDAIKNKLHIKE